MNTHLEDLDVSGVISYIPWSVAPLDLSSTQWLLLVLQELIGITLKALLLKRRIHGQVSPGLWIAHLSGFVMGDSIAMLELC